MPFFVGVRRLAPVPTVLLGRLAAFAPKSVSIREPISQLMPYLFVTHTDKSHKSREVQLAPVAVAVAGQVASSSAEAASHEKPGVVLNSDA
jgi:hypothetical protein